MSSNTTEMYSVSIPSIVSKDSPFERYFEILEKIESFPITDLCRYFNLVDEIHCQTLFTVGLIFWNELLPYSSGWSLTEEGYRFMETRTIRLDKFFYLASSFYRYTDIWGLEIFTSTSPVDVARRAKFWGSTVGG